MPYRADRSDEQQRKTRTHRHRVDTAAAEVLRPASSAALRGVRARLLGSPREWCRNYRDTLTPLVYGTIVPQYRSTWSHSTYFAANLEAQKRSEEPSRSKSEFDEV